MRGAGVRSKLGVGGGEVEVLGAERLEILDYGVWVRIVEQIWDGDLNEELIEVCFR